MFNPNLHHLVELETEQHGSEFPKVHMVVDLYWIHVVQKVDEDIRVMDMEDRLRKAQDKLNDVADPNVVT